MSAVASKNLYALLGNDHDEDSDKEPEPPVKVVDKTPARTTKRNAPSEAPASKVSAPSGGRRGPGGNEGAFRDRNAGSANNRGKPTDDGARQDRPPRAQGTYDGRGNRGGRGGNRNYDRHSRSVGGESEKQAGHGWGANEGGAELADEQAAEVIASADQKDALTGDGEAAPVDATAPEPETEPEDHSISYSDYLAQQAEKKLALGGGIPEPRKPNEGTKQDKKWANAKPIPKDEEEEDFIAGTGGKSKRERERKQKQLVEIDQRFVETPDRGGRGGFRGGRGGRGGPGGQHRGGEFRGPRGEGRGGRGEHGERRPRGDGPPRSHPPRDHANKAAAPINPGDTSAFPSLGS